MRTTKRELKVKLAFAKSMLALPYLDEFVTSQMISDVFLFFNCSGLLLSALTIHLEYKCKTMFCSC